ncbi:MAG: homogentisate 1,2-dioxygenase, partial [Roseomonas sp.]|nr:homogentisate 1,2-dioxygenase [Roseomonas sp.]
MPKTKPPMTAPVYMTGFGNSFETEALPDALPVGRNSPQKCHYGLYAEQLSGSAFTAPHGKNERSWLYRIRPSVKHSGFYRAVDPGLIRTAPNAAERQPMLGQYRWDPMPMPRKRVSFVEGLTTITTAGDSDTQTGMAAHIAFITRSMRHEYFSNADGELLIVAQQGRLRFCTEFGVMEI